MFPFTYTFLAMIVRPIGCPPHPAFLHLHHVTAFQWPLLRPPPWATFLVITKVFISKWSLKCGWFNFFGSNFLNQSNSNILNLTCQVCTWSDCLFHRACLVHYLGHVWGIIWGMSRVSSGACLGHVLGIIWGMSGAYCQQWTTIRSAICIYDAVFNVFSRTTLQSQISYVFQELVNLCYGDPC